MDKYEEHLMDSAPDNSCWDGFDRGDFGPGIGEAEDYYHPTEEEMDKMMAELHGQEQAVIDAISDQQLEMSDVREELLLTGEHHAYIDWKEGTHFQRMGHGVTSRWAYLRELERLIIDEDMDGDIPF
jgi:hypothetical protein